MYAQVEKKKENKIGNKSRVITNSVVQKKATGKQGFGFVDNRQDLNGVVQMRFIGEPARHHMHIEIRQPHYKNGNNQRSRINIGVNQVYRRPALQEVINTLNNQVGEPGAAACINWCNAEIANFQ